MMPRCRGKPRTSDQRGLALISVLWVLMVIAVLMTGFAVVTHAHRHVTINVAHQSRAHALVNAGLNRAAIAMQDPDPRYRWHPDGQVYRFPFEGDLIEISVADENGKIDINTAPEQLLLGLLAALGIPDEQAQALSDAIQDWRDPDDLRRLHGAEREEYRKAGQPGPANELFANIAELTQVLGMTPELYSRLAPFVTVYSGRQQINPVTAAAEVLMAIPGARLDDIAEAIALRQVTTPNYAQGVMNRLTWVGQFANAAPGPAYTITLAAATGPGGGVRASAEVVIWLTGDGSYRILEWRDRNLALDGVSTVAASSVAR